MAAKVLVVDDEKMIVKGLRFSLMQEGYEVECVIEGLAQSQDIRDVYIKHIQNVIDEMN